MVFSLNGSTGSYHFSGSDNATRTLQLESHNPSGRTLVYKAYLRGRYIGKFKGKYTLQNMGSSSYMDYNCTFISVNGARINYSLSGTIDGDY